MSDPNPEPHLATTPKPTHFISSVKREVREQSRLGRITGPSAHEEFTEVTHIAISNLSYGEPDSISNPTSISGEAGSPKHGSSSRV